jgi:hypothetical protein
MNASGRFARMLSKRTRHQRSRSALAHIHPTTKSLTTLQFASAEGGTVSGKEHKNITVRLATPSPFSIALSAKEGDCLFEHCQGQIMPKPINVDWPAVRVLAVAVGVREAARQMGISQDAVRQRSKREGWMASPKTVAQRSLAKPVTSVSPNALSPADALANVFGERKHRTKLGLSKYAAEAAEQAAEHRDKLGIASKVKDVASVHKTLWPEENQREPILNLAVLTGEFKPQRVKPAFDAETGKIVNDDQEEEISKELPSPVIEENEKVIDASGSANDCDATNPIRLSPPKPDNARVSAEHPSRSAYRERCMYWRRYTR